MATSRKNEDPQAQANADAGVSDTAEKVQAAVDTETEQGFRGVEVDPTPNSAYTVQGVTAGAPTPETDVAQADEAARRQRDVASPGNGPGPR
jgi:hypothetical protein